MSIRATIQDESTEVQEYIRRTVPDGDLINEGLRQQKPCEEKEEDRPSWRDKPLHGM